MKREDIKIVIIAQNVFIAVVLGRLAGQCKTNVQPTILVPSKLEKWLLKFLFKDKSSNFEFRAISDFEIRKSSAVEQAVYETVEFKRRSVFKARLFQLAYGLNGFLAEFAEKRYEDGTQIWIYNRWTWIGQCLAVQESLPSCFIFENANYKKSICVVGDLSAKTSDKARNDFLNFLKPLSVLDLSNEVKSLKRLRVPALILSITNRGGYQFYAKRLLTRLFVVVVFKILKQLKYKEQAQRHVLVIMQIEYDSEILRHGTPREYRETLFEFLLPEVESQGNIVLRPHPNDFSLGWLKLYIRLKMRGAKVSLSLDDAEHLHFERIGHMYTYSSNFIRLVPDSYDKKNITVIKNLPALVDVDAKKYSVYEGLL